MNGLASHETGTCRMGHDPRTSVLNPFCRAHDVANLFVVDGSPFVTLPEKNPTLTIMALAVRTARHIADIAQTVDRYEATRVSRDHGRRVGGHETGVRGTGDRAVHQSGHHAQRRLRRRMRRLPRRRIPACRVVVPEVEVVESHARRDRLPPARSTISRRCRRAPWAACCWRGVQGPVRAARGARRSVHAGAGARDPAVRRVRLGGGHASEGRLLRRRGAAGRAGRHRRVVQGPHRAGVHRAVTPARLAPEHAQRGAQGGAR